MVAANKTNLPGSRGELVEGLQNGRARLREWFSINPYPAIPDLVYCAVQGNTFRAFHGPPPPSAVFRAWGNAVLSEEATIDRIIGLQTQAAYDKWLWELCQNLMDYWENERKDDLRMTYGRARKMTNLLMKHFTRWTGISEEQRERLIPLLHVPLDEYTLKALRVCLPERRRNDPGPRIRAGASMGSIKDEETYIGLQNLAREIANEAGVPPIYIDLLAWNDTHSDKHLKCW